MKVATPRADSGGPEFILSVALFALVISETTAEGVYFLIRHELNASQGFLSVLNFLRLAATGISTPLILFKGELQAEIRKMVATYCTYIGTAANLIEAIIVFTSLDTITAVSNAEA